MKTIFKTGLLIALAALATTAHASGNLNVNIQPLNADKAVVMISSLTESNLKISVEDSQGKVVFSREVTEPTGNYRKVFDFSDLAAGQYRLLVENDCLTTEREFKVNDWKIEVGGEKTNLEPFFAYSDGLLRFTYLNFSNDDLTLYFYHKKELIYSKDLGNGFNVNEALSLSKLDKGNYTAVLSTKDKKYSHDLTIK